jgi:hypothetical protein
MMHDSRKVIPDSHARYYGTEVDEQSIVPLGNARLGKIKFQEWLRTQQVPA